MPVLASAQWPEAPPWLVEGLSTPSGKVTVAVAVGVTASGALYLLARNAVGSGKGKAPRAQVLQLTTLVQLQQYAGLRGQLNARLTWLTAARHLTAVCVPNQGAALAAFPSGLCALPQLTQLCLAGSAIAEVPPAIGRLRRLRDLDLSRCRLASVPPELGALRELKYLNLMGNQLEALPDTIGQLTNLYRLGLKSNRLAALPASIGQLGGLVELFLTDNRLERLPPEMGQLRNLVKLQASFNEHLSELPEEMGALQRLELLRVACCDIHELTPSFADLQSLAWLSLASNPLTGAKHPNFSSAHLPVVTLAEMEMGRKLGEGASGEVFAATWRGKSVAVKIFQAEKSPDGHSRDEMAIAVALSNSNLIRMLGVLEQPLGLVMELVQGRPLAEKPNFESLLRCRWPKGADYSLDFILTYAMGLANALEHMHYRGVAHGDVYAHNVLADEEGRVFLCDYGASFFYKKGSGIPFEGQEVRAYGLLLKDLVARLDVTFEAMDAILAAQKALVVLVTSCTTGPAVQRPCFGAVGRALRDIQRTYHKARKGGTPRSTPASTPRPTPRGGAVAS